MLNRSRTVAHKLHDDDGQVIGGGCTYLSASVTLVLDTELVGDMGNPDTITITVEPGDKLNEPAPSGRTRSLDMP